MAKSKKSRKTVRADYDSAWKDVIHDLFPHFMGTLFPEAHKDIDYDRGVEFLDKELSKINPEHASGKRYVDSLAKVWLKNGGIAIVYVLLHIEVQNVKDEGFPERMFVYFYRLYDRMRQPGMQIVSLGVLTDADSNWRPDCFGAELWGCSFNLHIPIVKLIDFRDKPEYQKRIQDPKNPLSIIIRAWLKNLEVKRTDTDQRFNLKREFIRECYRENQEPKDLKPLLKFIDWMLQLSQDMEAQILDVIQECQKEYNMEYVASWERIWYAKGKEIGVDEGYEQGIEQGIEKGIEQGIEQGVEQEKYNVARELLKRGYPTNEIADITRLPIEEVRALIEQ